MCNHGKYVRLGYLMIYGSDENSPLFDKDLKDVGVRHCYSGHTNFASTIIVYQCQECGEVKLSNGVLEKICQKEGL